jgi:hypothetical protein
LKKQKLKKSSNKPKKSSDKPFFIQILNFKLKTARKSIDKPENPTDKPKKNRLVFNFFPKISKIEFCTKNRPVFLVFTVLDKTGEKRFLV